MHFLIVLLEKKSIKLINVFRMILTFLHPQ